MEKSDQSGILVIDLLVENRDIYILGNNENNEAILTNPQILNCRFLESCIKFMMF